MSSSQQPREGFLSALRRIICRWICYDGPSAPPAKPRLRTFEPGKVAILAEYPPQLELTPRQIIDRVTAQLNKLDVFQREKVQFTPERVVILRGRQLTLATVFGDVPAAREDPARLIRFISQLHRTIRKPPLEGRPTGDGPGQGPKDYPPTQSGPAQQPGGETGSPASNTGAAQLAATGAPALAARALTPDPDGFDVRAASPNWYSSGSKNIIGGGPGGWPVVDTKIATVPEPWAFTRPTSSGVAPAAASASR